MATIDTLIEFGKPFAVICSGEFPEHVEDGMFIEFDPKNEGYSIIAIPVRRVMVSTSDYGEISGFVTGVFRVPGEEIEDIRDAAHKMDTRIHLYEVGGSIDAAFDLRSAELNNYKLALQIMQRRAAYDPKVIYIGERYLPANKLPKIEAAK